jgi:hypothetical protein
MSESNTVDRREALKRVSAMLGGVALVGGSALLNACSREPSVIQQGAGKSLGTFTPADVSLLDEVAETILPETKTPGAKAAGVGPFMALMVTDCYDERDQAVFRKGMQQLDAASKDANGTSFVAATPEQRLALLRTLDAEQKKHMDTKAADAPAHYFRMMKELAMLGYFTSEIGYTKAQRYAESPGRWDPCAPYVKGETSWAPHA